VVTASPAHCDADGGVISGNGSAYLYGDGSGTFTGPDGSVQNFGDRSGNYTDGTVTIQNFGDGTALVDDEMIDAVAQVFTTLDIAEAQVSGHTDAIGSDAENQVLSEQRAESVVDGLQERGVTTSLTAEGFGESRPVAATRSTVSTTLPDAS